MTQLALSNDDSGGIVPNEIWKAVGSYGFTTVAAALLMYYVAFYVVEPMRQDQQEFMRSVIETNKAHAAALTKQTDIQQQQATALTKQTEIQQQQAGTLSSIVPLLQQIRDDQRRGAWKDH